MKNNPNDFANIPTVVKPITQTQFDRLKRCYEKQAGGEQIRFEIIDDIIMIHGSELATLRIFQCNSDIGDGTHGYSRIEDSFYYARTLNNFSNINLLH